MYKIFYLALIAITLNCFNIHAQNDASSLINDALEKAKNENKQVFVNYYTTSCIDSNKMKKQMSNDAFKSLFNSNYVIVNIEVPKEQTSEYINCSNPVKFFSGNNCDVIKFPFWYVIDETGNFSGSSFNNDNNIGYPMTQADIEYFIDVIRNTSKFTEHKLTLIANSF